MRGRLCLGDLAALDAAGADADALGSAVDQGLDGLQIDVPAPAGDVVRVGDVVTELRAFAANIAYLCHDFAPNVFLFRAAGSKPLKMRIKERAVRVSKTGRAVGARRNTQHRQLAESPVYPESGWEPS